MKNSSVGAQVENPDLSGLTELIPAQPTKHRDQAPLTTY